MLPTELLDKPIFQMTGGEFMQLMKHAQPPMEATEKQDLSTGEFISGISGLARFLGCGRTKASEYRKSGLLEDATYDIGKKLFFHKEKVKEILKNQ